VLVEIGGTVPGPGLYILDSAFDDPAAFAAWLAVTRPYVDAWRSVPAVPVR